MTPDTPEKLHSNSQRSRNQNVVVRTHGEQDPPVYHVDPDCSSLDGKDKRDGILRSELDFVGRDEVIGAILFTEPHLDIRVHARCRNCGE